MRIIGKRVLFNRNILIIIIVTIGMLPALISFGGYYIFGDITTQMLPFVYETKRMLASGVPFWSWNTYFGDNFIASYAYYTMFNPFTWINCLFPYKYLGIGFSLVLYLKFLLCGYVTQVYLNKMGFGVRLSLTGCLLYTFSSWAITNLFYYMFLEPMILFPFLLLFVERLLRKEYYGYIGLVIAVFVVVAVNYYFAAINIIAATMYFFCRLLYLYIDRRERLWLTVKAAGCVVLGIISAAAIVIPVLAQLMGSPRMGLFIGSWNLFLILERFFWLVFPKTHEGGSGFYIFFFTGWRSTAAAITVFGLLPTLLLFTKKRYGWIKWLTAIMLVIYLTPLNGVFSLFTYGYYTRWAYIFTFTLIIGTLYYIKDYGLPSIKYASIYCAIVYGTFFIYAGVSIYWHYNNSGESLSGVKRLTMDSGVIALNAISLLLLCANKLRKRISYLTILLIMLCAAFQFLVFSIQGCLDLYENSDTLENLYFTKDEKFSSESEFNYRTSFSMIQCDRGPQNYGLICNRPSIETFHSVQNSKINKWSSLIGDTIVPSCVFYPLYSRKSFESLMSVKDLIVISDEAVDTCISGRFIQKDGIFNIYESDHYIPMGFAYDRYIITDTVEVIAKNNRSTDIPKILLSALSIKKSDEEELKTYLEKANVKVDMHLDSLVAQRCADACDKFTGHTKGFDAHIKLDAPKVVFFSVVADDGFKAYIDGEQTKIYETNLGFSSVIVPAGSHEISFRYFPPGLKLGILLSMIGLTVSGFMFSKRL